MGSDPQSYLQHQHDQDMAYAMMEMRKQLPFAVYSGSEKFDYGPKRISALCQSQDQAEVLIKGMWPNSGYWESIDEICGLCGYRRGDHRSERWAHHSECTVEAFVVRVDKSIGNHEDRPSKVPVSQLRRSSVERTRKRRGKAFNEATVQLPMPKMY